jgi:uroporphyrinogen decarboxylase
MMDTKFTRFVQNRHGRMAMPIGVYAGLEITGATVRQAVSDPAAQTEAVLALHDRFHTPVMLTAMDLSAEAETFGCAIRMSDEEIPTVLGRRATTPAEIAALPTPQPGDLRTAVHLQVAQNLVKIGKTPVLGGMIGPFSLAGRIFGVSEALEATATDPDLLLSLLEKVTAFLKSYAGAFRSVGAMGLIIAEPASGLLSPRGLATFSAPFVSQVIQAVQAEDFTIIYHNCGAKIVHLPRILEMGAAVYHFGQPMDLPAALEKAQGQAFLAGNLDPTAVFHSGTPDDVRRRTAELLEATRPYAKYIVSSGCDLPPGVPVQNLDAFYQTVSDFS